MPLLLFTQPPDWQPARGGRSRTQDEYLANGYTLIYQPHFDQMLYFWPVEDCQLVIRTHDLDADLTTRLVRAALRDGAELAIAHHATVLTMKTRFYDQKSGWKKPSHEMEYDVPAPTKKNRYEMTLALIKEADREAGR